MIILVSEMILGRPPRVASDADLWIFTHQQSERDGVLQRRSAVSGFSLSFRSLEGSTLIYLLSLFAVVQLQDLSGASITNKGELK